MIIPDLNLLIYAYDSSSPWHEAAKRWWTGSLSGTQSVGIPWVVALGFIRLWTSPRVFRNPMTVDQAATHVESWLQRPMVRAVNPGPRHAELAFSFLRTEGKGGNLTTDAHLAALAIEANATLHTADTDFLRFPGLRWINPLSGGGTRGQTGLPANFRQRAPEIHGSLVSPRAGVQQSVPKSFSNAAARAAPQSPLGLSRPAKKRSTGGSS